MKIPLKETLIAISCVGILAGLGTWQVYRLQWKQGLVNTLESAYAAGEDTPGLTTHDLDGLETNQNPMMYGKVAGHLLRDKAILLGPKTEDGKIGYNLIVPMVMGHSQKTLLINAGWVSDLWKDTLKERLSSLPMDGFTANGLIRKPDWSSFASKNSPANDFWFRADVQEIATAKNIPSVYPFILYADHSAPTLQDISYHEKGWLPPNNHFQYALFWFSMAAVFLGIYGLYIRKLHIKKAP